MAVKDFFRLAIRLIALYFFFTTVLSLVNSLGYFTHSDTIGYAIIWVIIGVLIPLIILYIVFLKSDWIISKLCLDNGFENHQLNFGNLNSKEIIKISILIISIVLLVNNIPDFLADCFYAFKYSVEPKLYVDNSYKNEDYYRMAISLVKILIAYLMIQNYKRITNWIDK